MTARFQLVIDCEDPGLLARFWAAALGYVLEPPPEGFATWDDWRRDVGLTGDELVTGVDSIIDPRGHGPRIWFHAMPDAKVAKNRLHLDIHVSTLDSQGSTDDRYVSSVRGIPFEVRKQRVDADARRLADLGATITGALTAEGSDHYAMGMQDPEGNEFDIN